MQSQKFKTQVRMLPHAAIIDLEGEINGQSEAVLDAAYQQAVRANPQTVLLNFNGVDYINSTGIALIVGLLGQARKTGRTVYTYGLSDHYAEIFRITRLSEFTMVFADEASALAAL